MRGKRVLMLIPPHPKEIPARWFLREERHAAVDNTPTPPYMAPSVLGMVRHRIPDAEYRVIDCMATGWRGERIREEVAAWSPDVIIAVLCANHLGEEDERLCGELPYPTIAIVTPVGAPVRDVVDQWNLRIPCYVVTDEVEVSTADAVEELFRTGRIQETKGLEILQESRLASAGFPTDRVGGAKGLQIFRERKLVSTGFPGYSDLSKYPLPAFDLFPFDVYNRLQDEFTVARPDYKDTAIINGMKGCPFHCNFCIVGGEQSKSRVKTGKQIFDEVKVLYERFGRRRFNFLDSEFAANKKTAKDFCRMVIESDMKIRFDVKNRIEFLDEVLLSLMKKAGCERIFYGIETADPQLQKNINKFLDLEKAKNAIQVTKRHGLKVYLYMMVGIVGETRESLRLNARFVAETKPDGISWGILFPEVGSPWYDELRDSGQLVEKNWLYYRKYDRITFQHDTYKNMSEIRRASLWLRTEYRRLLAMDSSVPVRVRIMYFVRYLAGVLNYHFIDKACEANANLGKMRVTLGLRFDALLSRFARQPML